MDSLNIVRKLRPVQYNYTAESVAANLTSHQRTKLGFIAQELAELFPPDIYSVVTQQPNGYYAVDEIQLISVLAKALQNLDAKVTELEQKVEELGG